MAEKEYRIKTNADKFREVFGVGVNEKAYGHKCSGIKCPSDIVCDECKYNGFWLKEYVEPKREEN